MIQAQGFDRCPAYWRKSHQPFSIPFEAVWPQIAARVVQTSHYASLRIDSRKICSFEIIAMETSESQIFVSCLPSVKLCNNVVELKGRADQNFRQETILATKTRPRANKLFNCRTHPEVFQKLREKGAPWISLDQGTSQVARNFPIPPLLFQKGSQRGLLRRDCSFGHGLTE
jgi:hypothetical protein